MPLPLFLQLPVPHSALCLLRSRSRTWLAAPPLAQAGYDDMVLELLLAEFHFLEQVWSTEEDGGVRGVLLAVSSTCFLQLLLHPTLV